MKRNSCNQGPKSQNLSISNQKSNTKKQEEKAAIPVKPREIPSIEIREVLSETTVLKDCEDYAGRLESESNADPNDAREHGFIFERRGAVIGQDVLQEQQWAKKAKVGWGLIAAGCVLVFLVITAVFISNYFGDEIIVSESHEDIQSNPNDPYEGSPEQWFHKHIGTIEKQAVEVMDSYLSSKDAKGKSLFVRDVEQYFKRQPNWDASIQARADNGKNRWDISHAGKVGFLTLDTWNEEFLPMRLYFIKKEEQLKIDWEASTAWSEKSFSNLRTIIGDSEGAQNRGLGEPVMLRCMLRRQNDFYAGPYNDKDHASFMILSPDKSQSFWAYTDRDSELDKELRKLLDHGSFVVGLKKDIRVTVRVARGRKDALPSQLELMELVHEEWVKP